MRPVFSMILSIALGSTLPHASVAGTPDQDPIIKDIRDRFEKGSAPTREELLSKAFECEYHWALRGYFSDDFNTLRFVSLPVSDYLFEQMLVDNGHYLPYVHNGQEWITTARSDTDQELHFFSIRKDNSANLILEYGQTNFGAEAELIPLSTAPNGTRVVGYGICFSK
jgi:hypothetical protein